MTMAARATGLAMIAAMGAVGSVSAQPAQYSSKDIISTFAKKPAAPAPTGAGECEKKGMVTGDDGVCEPTKNARGFSLPTRATVHSPAAASAMAAPAMHEPHAAAAKPRTVASIAPRRAMAPAAPAAHRDLLITFKPGSSELTDQAKANAKVFAEALNSPALSGAKFDLSGYTDASGDKDKNMVLSQSRAASVKTFLVSQGVSDARLEAHGYGASDFAVPTAPTSPRNRRVEAKRVE